MLFAVIFYSRPAMSSCDGGDCSSDSGVSAIMIFIVLFVIIGKMVFWSFCCYFHSRERTHTVRVYRRLESGGSPVNVRARTAPMTSPVSESQRTRPKKNDSVQQGQGCCNPGHDSSPRTILSIANEHKPPPYADQHEPPSYDANEVPC